MAKGLRALPMERRPRSGAFVQKLTWSSRISATPWSHSVGSCKRWFEFVAEQVLATVVADQATLDEPQHHAAVLFEQALCRLARTSQGAAFTWWARVVRNMRHAEEAQERAARLFEQALCRLARSSQGAAFAWWSRVSRNLRLAEEAQARAARLLSQALNRMARASQAGCFMWWQGVVREARETDVRGRPPFHKALVARAEIGARGVRLVAPRPATARPAPRGGASLRPSSLPARAKLRRRVVRLLARHRQAGD